MIEIQMSRDIREFETKILGPFTFRQLVCILLSCLYGIPMMVFLPIKMVPAILIACAAMAPLIAAGWIKPYGIPLERYIFKCVIPVLRSGKRLYKTENSLDYLSSDRVKPKKVVRLKEIKGYQ